jgi:hypothetical protein
MATGTSYLSCPRQAWVGISTIATNKIPPYEEGLV